FSTLLGAAHVLRGDKRVAFLITGDGAKLESLRQRVTEARLDSFCFQPYQPPQLLADSLAAADVHLISLLPALEGLIVPSKLYGILAAGRPVVFIGDLDGEVARVLRNHACGVSVGIGDSEGLAAELTAMADSPEHCMRLGRQGRHLAVTQYSAEGSAFRWGQLLADIAPAVGSVTDFERPTKQGASAGPA
ncbi:MAG TPA: glycosyltransferase, partial [Steroidobacteraceae bacterium]|nr:glycosyltransferase [Steroidobacteraceae bacterium]